MTGKRELRCDMTTGCAAPVTHVDNRGFVYCATHGESRKSSTPCRKLSAAELRSLENGETIPYKRESRPKVERVERCGMRTASGYTCLFPRGHLGSCESPYAMRVELDRLRGAIVSRLVEGVELLDEATVRAALEPCVGGKRLVEVGLEFLRDGSLAKAMRAAQLAAPPSNGIEEGRIEIAGVEYRTRTFTRGAFDGLMGVEVAPSSWLEEATARQHLARHNAELREAMKALTEAVQQAYGVSEATAVRLLAEIAGAE